MYVQKWSVPLLLRKNLYHSRICLKDRNSSHIYASFSPFANASACPFVSHIFLNRISRNGCPFLNPFHCVLWVSHDEFLDMPTLFLMLDIKQEFWASFSSLHQKIQQNQTLHIPNICPVDAGLGLPLTTSSTLNFSHPSPIGIHLIFLSFLPFTPKIKHPNFAKYPPFWSP